MKNAYKACAFVLGAALFAPALASAQNNMPGQPGQQQAAPAAMPTTAKPSYKDLVAKKKTLLQQKKARKAKLAQDKKALAMQEKKEIAAVNADKTLTKAQKKAKIAAIKKDYTGQRKGMWANFKKDMGGIGHDLAGVGHDMKFWHSSHHHGKAKKIAKKMKAHAKAAPAAPAQPTH